MRIRVILAVTLGVVSCSGLLTESARAADTPSIKQALSIPPVSSDVEYETPDAKSFDQCKVNVERQGKSSGWVVLGPAGQTLRRFVDTNGDNVVDQWRYYLNGVEVYRDIDSNFNNKADQMRWLNLAGTRWGIDANEDGRIESWKQISAEEASREAIRALVAGDERLLQLVLINKADLAQLGLTGKLADKLLENVDDAGAKLRKAGQSKLLTSKMRWIRFDSQMPSVVPADQVNSKSDLYVHETAMAIVETGGQQTGLVQIGEMVRVGDVWKLTRLPQPFDGEGPQVADLGLFMQAVVADAAPATPMPATTGVTSQVQKLIEELQTLDKESPSPTASKTQFVKYNTQRADLMQKLLEAAQSDEEREQWTRQMADGIAAAVHSGGYPAGLARLDKLYADVKKSAPKSNLAAYVAYRKLLAQYNVELQQADTEKRNEIQERWLKDLEEFVTTYPKSEDAAEATLQLGITQEFNGKVKEARTWYGTLVSNHPETAAAKRAAGALRRLDLKGKPFELKGHDLAGAPFDAASLQGKVVLVLFWDTQCKPCTEELPLLRALYAQYHDRGFEIVGVNLDLAKEDVKPYLVQHKVTWPQVYEPGGFESSPALSYGIISLPTMFLVDQNRNVLHRSASITDLKTLLPEVMKKE